LLEGVQAFVRDKWLLVVLDNFEQVIEAAPPSVKPLGRHAGRAARP